MSAQQAAEWLKSDNSGNLRETFDEFLNKHGHRCVREAELREISWHLEPAKVVEAVQLCLSAMSVQKNRTTEHLSVAETIARLSTPLNFVKRFVLRQLIPRARRAVGEREWGKSLSIKMVDHFRLAYRELARQMVRESRLPDADLIFFFTHHELKVLLKTRSAKMIGRAIRRRRCLDEQMSLSFEHWYQGYPVPTIGGKCPSDTVDHSSNTEIDGDEQLCIRGTAVGCGVAEGKARVIRALIEAKCIQAGEILVVPYTDVGWTPYFPLINGLVTEMGGIISHGAVVAREYGLPCVVNAKRSTQLLKTGDLIRVQGADGLVKRLKSAAFIEKSETPETNGLD